MSETNQETNENVFKIELPKKLNNKQKFVIKHLIKLAKDQFKDNQSEQSVGIYTAEKLKRYIDSLNGKSMHNDARSELLNIKGKDDTLANKPAGSIFKMIGKRYDSTHTHEVPKHDLGNWIGVEIECFIPNSSVNTARKIAEECKRQQIKYVHTKSDGSIEPDGDSTGFEFAVITNINDMSNLEKFLKLINSMDADVNRSCGLHIHLDQRDLPNATEVGRRAFRLNNSLEFLAKLVPKTRRNNSYCKMDRTTMSSDERYSAINTTAYAKYKTLEVRLHSGSTDFKKISNWIKVLFAISRASKMKRTYAAKINSFEDFKALVPDLDSSVYEYTLARMATLNPELTPETKTDFRSIVGSENEDMEPTGGGDDYDSDVDDYYEDEE